MPETSSLIVAVRVRPILKMETARGNKRDILRVMDERMVVVLDPDESKVVAVAVVATVEVVAAAEVVVAGVW